MLDFSALKKSSSLGRQELSKKVEEANAGSGNSDERFWKCSIDKSGSGFAVIRFLPSPKGEDLPWVKYYRHAFKGPTGNWYIENSLSSLNQPDPVGELNQKLWNEGKEDRARAQKRNKTFVSNIQVIKDKANPENEGKVFLFRYGQQIFDILSYAMNPTADEDDEDAVLPDPINPFDFWEGANFKLKIRTENKQITYKYSAFEKPSALSDDDDVLEQIWEKQYSLIDFLDPKNFKSYEDLQKRLDLVLNGTKPTKAKSEDSNLEEDDEDDEEEENFKKMNSKKKPTKKVEEDEDDEDDDEDDVREESSKPKHKYGEDDEDDDDIPDYFGGDKLK